MMTEKKNTIRTSGLAMIALALLAMPIAAHAAAFTNGSFESPDVATGSPGSSGDIAGIAPWTFTENADDIRHYDGDFYGSGTVAQDGDQYVGFTSNGASGGGVLSQSFDTAIGTKYSVVFWANNIWFQTGEADSHSLTAAVDNGAADSLLATPSVNAQGVGVWEQFAFDFVASSTTTTLSFTSVIVSGPSSSADILLDNVSVSVFVPSPAALPAGLLALATLAARRRR